MHAAVETNGYQLIAIFFKVALTFAAYRANVEKKAADNKTLPQKKTDCERYF